jgi:hypothetical protein
MAEGHRHQPPDFQSEISRLASEAEEDSVRRDAKASLKKGKKGPLWNFIWAGLALAGFEALSLAVLYTLQQRQLTLQHPPPNRILKETECPAEVYKIYWKIVAFIHEKGHPPAALAELIPGYVDRMPADPQSGKPLAYRTDGKRFTVSCAK